MTRGTSQKGPQKKKGLTHCGPGPRCSLTSFPGRLFRPGPAGFFCCSPARTLTHSLQAWAAMPPAGVFVFFFGAAPPGPGWLFFCCGPARTLTYSLWAVATSARPGWCFFCFFLRPRRTRRANNKKCLVYYIGSKKTRRGHSRKKKKNTSNPQARANSYRADTPYGSFRK